MKATLRRHAYVIRSVHGGTAVTSTIPGLILAVLGWAWAEELSDIPLLP